MKRIHYAEGSFLTDDAVADALMHYASILAVIDSADVVSCPGLDGAGNVQVYQLLIGPASQIMASTTDETEVAVDLPAAKAVAELRRRASGRLPESIDVGQAGTRRAESDAESTTHEESAGE